MAVAAVAAIVGALWWFNRDDSNTSPTGQSGGYTEGLAGTWQRINPLFAAANEVDADLSSLVFSGLLRIGPDGSPEPDLADALPDITDDGRTYTFHLRKALTWQDGAPLTSKDVAFTISRLTDPEFKGDPALAEPWIAVTVETPDSATIVVRLKQPSAPFLARNATIGIIPEHLLNALNGAALFDAPFNGAPIGSGPYRLTTLDTRGALLAANPQYHFGAPKIGALQFRFYSDYPSAVRGIAAGEIQSLLVQEPLDEAQLTGLAKVKGTATTTFDRSTFIALYLNNDRVAFFEDSRVRQAISLALDRQAIVDGPMQGSGTVSASPIEPGSWAHSPDFDRSIVNRARAIQLLKAASWKTAPGADVRTRDGQEFRFTIRTDNDPVRLAVAREVSRQLEPLGIRATVASTTFAVLRRDFLQSRNYDASIAGWDQGPDPDPYFGWHSSQLGTGGLNLANFQDVVTDELIAKARTIADAEVRKDLYRQFQEKWDSLAPSVVLAYPQFIFVHAEALKGISAGILSTPSQRFYDIQKWTR